MADKPIDIRWTDINILSGKTISKLDDRLVTTLTEEFGFITPTKVQNSVIPLFLSNKDVCVKACTGSGKTLSFVIPIVQKML